MAWTEQQQNAIDSRGTSLIVSAAAGSGKTAVLTERLIRLIADPKSEVRADRMVIVTFTNDSASELKKRLDRKLRDLINENPLDSHLIKQQVLLQNARISTINSFCFELIRDNIAGQGITSGFSVLDETDDNVLKAQAMEDLINYYSENEYDKISFLYDKFCTKTIKSLTEVISGLDKFLSSVAFGDRWLDKTLAEYRKDFKQSVYYREFMSECSSSLTEAERLAEECIDMLDDIFSDDTENKQYNKRREQAEDELKKVKWFAEIFRSGRIPDISETEKAHYFERAKGISGHEAERTALKNKRDKFKEIVQKTAVSETLLESDFIESGEVTEVLFEVIRKYQELVWEKKCAKNALSFADGERLALEILADTDGNGNIVPSETAHRIADFYDIIMVDEYQDTNNKQDLIFRLMSKNCYNDENGEVAYGNNVFLVGDVKQAIYRFRLANPQNFIKTLETSEEYGTDGTKNKKIFLNTNFRSSESVLDFSNYVFHNLMTRRCGEVEYNDKEWLNFGAERYRNEKISPTHISFINVEKSPENSEKKKSAKKDEPNLEAIFTARKIAEMLKNGTEVILENGTTRRCVPSDFCILVRANKYVNQYADELEKLGIPSRRNEEKGYLKSREIALLTDLLRIINNPLADVPMTAVLTSPMYMFQISELAYIKALDTKKPLYSVILGIVGGEYPYCDEGLTERCAEFLKSIDRFRLDAVTMTTGELINSIYDTTDFISVMQLYSDGDKKRANLRALIQYAKSYENSVAYEGTGGLSGFLRHIDRVMENGDYEQGKISDSSGDYVTVTTLHKSKGLEYTFVFIAETAHEFNGRNNRNPILAMFSDDGKIGYTLYDPKTVRKYKTFQHTMIAEIKKRETRSEELRLLYVGFTRARQQLFVNLKYDKDFVKSFDKLTRQYILANGDIENLVVSANRFCDWLWTALMKHRDFAEIAEFFGIETGGDFPEYSKSEKIFECEFCEQVSEDFAIEEKNFKKAEPDKEVCERIRNIISDDYDNSLSEIPAKLSVTQISRKFRNDENFDYKLSRPKFISESKKLTGAERGTAVHTFFQYCDFEGAVINPSQELDRVVNMGYIGTAQAESIEIAKISAFFRSELYKRISESAKIWREKKFTVAVSDLNITGEIMEKFSRSHGMIKGIIDLMFEEKDGIVLVDYKSDRGVSGAYLEKRYRVQMQIYKSAIELTFGKKVKEAYLYSIELEKSIPVNI
ncbi:MAG: helicase-exonuclease AddAB subunit AddA [Ruminococcus sp.]|nr:helicase-exonuclease AddAB subunit AddA [Ruminococcus sp.]